MKKYLLAIVFTILGFIGFVNIVYGEDLLDEAYSDAENYQILKDKGSVEQSLGGGETSFIIKASQLLIRISAGVGIFVILFGGIKFITTVGDETKMKENRDSMLIALGGLIVILSSYFILEIMQSMSTDYIKSNSSINNTGTTPTSGGGSGSTGTGSTGS